MEDLLAHMEVASERDMESIQENKPAIEKFKMLKEVRPGLTHQAMHRFAQRMPPMTSSVGKHIVSLQGHVLDTGKQASQGDLKHAEGSELGP